MFNQLLWLQNLMRIIYSGILFLEICFILELVLGM